MKSLVILVLITTMGFFPLLSHNQSINQVFPYEQSAQFGTAIVAHGTGDGAYYPLIDEIYALTDRGIIKLCAIKTEFVSTYEYPYKLRKAVRNDVLELVACTYDEIMFKTFTKCVCEEMICFME